MAQVVVEHAPDGAKPILFLLGNWGRIIGVVPGGRLDVGTPYRPCVLEPGHYLSQPQGLAGWERCCISVATLPGPAPLLLLAPVQLRTWPQVLDR